jgi:hypothetical protein
MKKYLLGSLAAVIAFAGVAFTSAKHANRHPASTMQYHFKALEPLTNARVAGAYETFTSPPSDCNAADIVPCIVQYNTQQFSTLQAYLNSFSTDAQVVAAAIETRAN